MQQVADWLKQLGMSEYAERFADNDIDFSILRELTDQDLEKIGVASLGHRRKILRAIAALDGAATATAASPPLPKQAQTPTSAPTPAAGERRYLTVMFCDLVGSTAISAQLDAEEWRDLVGAYLDTASAAVTEMGGHVAKKLGDGLMCLFGYPLAHENDAERAARAALSIQRALAELNRKNAGMAKPELVARIGLESGRAVLDASGEIYGDVANIAARVQALAEPGAVLITAQVQRQVVGLFVAEERGTQTLKGMPEPTELFRLVRASGGGRRSGQRNLTPLVGRDEEIAMLMRRWERARQGEGQLTLIVGEPGLGKSRLIEEFHSRLSDTPHTWAEWSCSQLLQNTPLHPLAQWGRQRFGGADVPAERRLADLENTLALVKLDPVENAPLLAPLLDIPLPKERLSALAPEELRRRQLAAVTNWSMASAKTQPVVLVFEDLHWADPTTLDVLRGMAERGASVPLYIVATTRPEFRPPWGMRSHHGTISLSPLDRAQVREMVAELSARHALARDVVDDVATRTGGVPLFVEEVTRLLLEGGQGGIQVIPPTLQQSLMARLDRLGPAREVAQIGSVVGRGFSYKLLQAVAGMDHASLEAALEKLSEADIVLVEGVVPESDYRFKHALIQDAAYENLLKSRRQTLHRRIAETLRERFADKAAAEPEVLAHHFTQAGLTDAAIEWWGKAGDQALRRSAFQEAIAHLGKAIEIADKESEGAPRALAATAAAAPTQRLKLQTSYGQAMMLSRGFGSEEAKTAFTRARELATQTDAEERFDAYYGLWVASLLRGELRSARENAEIFLREANSAGRMTEAAVAHRNVGLTCLLQGDFEEAQTHFGQVLKIHDPERDLEVKFRFAADNAVNATVYLGWLEWQFGNFSRARELVEQSIKLAVATNHPSTLANAHFFKAGLEVIRGNAADALSAAEAVVQTSREYGTALYMAQGTVSGAWARAWLGHRDTGIAELRKALAAYSGQGNKMWLPFYEGLLAELEAEGQDLAGALTRIDEALALAGETGEHWSDAFLHRIRGEILFRREPGSTEPAEEALFTAIATARQQKARSFELRAAFSLAKLYQSTGRAADAHAVLAPALEGFSPTPEFPEIEQAQTLLAALAEFAEVKNAAASRQRRLKLQTNYGQAVMLSRGFAAEETKAAFTRATELAAAVNNPAERFAAYYGLWTNNLMRGETRLARETAERFCREAESGPWPTDVAVAYRCLGLTCLHQGDFVEAQASFARTLQIYDPAHDRDSKFRYGMHPAAAAPLYLGFIGWLRGEFEQANELIAEGIARAAETAHAPTRVNLYLYVSLLEAIRGDVAAAQRASQTVLELSREHGASFYTAGGALFSAWARARFAAGPMDPTELREALTAYTSPGNKMWVPLFLGLLAQIEAEGRELDSAPGRIDEAINLARDTGQHWSDAFLHRLRGEILLKRDPANTQPAEEAFLTAIAIAQQQKARSFELQASFPLARLYQSIGRAADAHAVLAPALEGFSPTPEFPEIAEAQALFAALTDTDEVKNAAASRQRRLKLQTGYAQAVAWFRGFGSEETKSAFSRARELVAGSENPIERFDTYYGLWVVSFVRGELRLARETAENFRFESENGAKLTEAAVANRNLGLTCLHQGEFIAAEASLERALSLYNIERDHEAMFRFGIDTGSAATVYLGYAKWILGQVGQAAQQTEEAIARAVKSAHAPTLAVIYLYAALLAILRGDAAAVRRIAEAIIELSEQHHLPLYLASATTCLGWARARQGESEAGLEELRNGISAIIELGNKLYVPCYRGLLAQLEAEGERAERALSEVGEALTLVHETGERWSDSFLQRVRGEILLKRDGVNTAPAEEAFLTAIAIAQQQKAKSFELQAALSLAKLYETTGRAADAHAVLAPALEGFSPTPEFPVIAEAQALLATLA